MAASLEISVSTPRPILPFWSLGAAAAATIQVNGGRLFVWFVAAAVTLERRILRAELPADFKGGTWENADVDKRVESQPITQ